MFNRKNIFSIRKSKVGVVSAKIATITLLFFAGGAVLEATLMPNQAVYADVLTAEESPTQETVIPSPVEYKADDSKAVGTSEVISQGRDGSLSLTTENDLTTVSRTEPTKTEVALGTQPTVVVQEEKAKTSYIADETLEAGQTETVIPAKDGATSTTTTYKIVTKPLADIGKEVEEKLDSDKYMYTDESFYSLDNSKALPSDKIVIDKLFVKVPDQQSVGKASGIREIIQDAVFSPSDGKYAGKSLTPEMLDPNDPEIRKLKEDYSYYWNDTEKPENSGYYIYTWDYSKDKDFYESTIIKNAWNIQRLSLGSYVSDDLYHTTAPITQAQALKNYHAKHHLTDSMYADAKANYLRMQLAADKLKELGEYDKMTEGVQGSLAVAEAAFKSITQHYNSLNGYDKTFEATYVGDDIPDSFKQAYREDIAKLPYELRKNLVNLFVSTEPLPSAAKTSNAAGIAGYIEKAIKLRYSETSNRYVLTPEGKHTVVTQVLPREQRRLLLVHELGHIVDFNSGLGNLGAVPTIKDYFSPSFNYAGFSTSKEFRDAYEKYMLPTVEIDPYFSQNPEEAFAEGFGQYVNKRVFGVPFDRYKYVNGIHYTIFPGEPGYEEGVTPYDKMEYYFATLYNQLFEQPVTAKAVVDRVVTSYQAPQNGLVKIGTKAKEEVVDIAYRTSEMADPSLAAGVRKLIQAGVNGQVLRVTRYALANAETGELTASVEERVLRAMVPEIVLVGSRQEAVVPVPSANPGERKLQTVATSQASDGQSKDPQLAVPQKLSRSEKSQLPHTASDSAAGASLLGLLGLFSGFMILKGKRESR